MNNHLSVCTAIKTKTELSEEARESSLMLTEAASNWTELLSTTTESNDIDIKQQWIMWERDTLKHVVADAVTCFVPEVEIGVINSVHSLVESERTRLVHVVSHKPLPRELHQLPLWGKRENELIVVSNDDLLTDDEEKQAIRYFHLDDVRWRLEFLLEIILKKCS